MCLDDNSFGDHREKTKTILYNFCFYTYYSTRMIYLLTYLNLENFFIFDCVFYFTFIFTYYYTLLTFLVLSERKKCRAIV